MTETLRLEFNDDGIYILDGVHKIPLRDVYTAWAMKQLKAPKIHNTQMIVEINNENRKYSSLYTTSKTSDVTSVGRRGDVDSSMQGQLH